MSPSTRGRRRALAVSLLVVVLSRCAVVANTTDADAAAATAESESETATAESALPELRFHVPFAVVSMEGLDLESRATMPADLRVRGKRTAPPACDATSTPPPSDGTRPPSPAPPPPYVAVEPTDRLVAVDGVAISLQPFHEVIDAPIGTTVMLPLFNSKADGNILTGFARVEIVRPQHVAFEPTTAARVADVVQWQTAVAAAEQAQLAQAQDERERAAAAENDALETAAREQREKEDQYRLEMTPHELVHRKRSDGREFRYEVLFTTRGPIGLNWDLLVEHETVVSHVEPKLAAERVGVIAPRDQLIQLNDIDTSAMAPAQVVQAYVQSTPPRRMVFRCAASAKAKAAAAAATATTASAVVPEKIQNWTMVFDSPAILRGWQARLHLATWSLEPRALEGTDDSNNSSNSSSVALVVATPITGCQPLGDAAGGTSSRRAFIAYRGGCSFVDKADKASRSHARVLIVVNNVKGLGRFPRKMPDVANVNIPVTMIGKLDGELVLSVLEYDPSVSFHVREEDPSVTAALAAPPVLPPKLTNQEMTLRRDPKKAARALTFWYVNKTSGSHATAEFRVLPALFGGNVTATPFRIVMAYPQDTACHPQGLGVLATQSVILVKRGGCSFGAKAKSVQTVGGAGMIMINSDESLLPLMSDPKETADLTIWAASIGLSNGTFIEQRLALNKNLPSLVKVATASIAAAT